MEKYGTNINQYSIDFSELPLSFLALAQLKIIGVFALRLCDGFE
jgi:hypothetical protein